MDDADKRILTESGVACAGEVAGTRHSQESVDCPAFASILYRPGESRAARGAQNVPAHFRDLNLDQIVDAITSGKEEYDLKALFSHESLKTAEAVAYRHEVMQDLEAKPVYDSITSFGVDMRLVRQKLLQADKSHHRYQKSRCHLHAVEAYCEAVTKLQRGIARLALSSHGLRSFRDYVEGYAMSAHFSHLQAEASTLACDLRKVQYAVLVKDRGFRVQNDLSESDYSQEVADVFQKFQQNAANSYLVKFHDYPNLNQIEEKVLDFVALLNPEVFLRLEDFHNRHENYSDPVLTEFDREIQFYLSYIEYMSVFKAAGLNFCYPEVSTSSKEVFCEDGFDLALAFMLIGNSAPVVCNDFCLKGEERIFVVSGPNQGGKTTFARMFGQLHYLASIGCPVPGKAARLLLFDTMFTHFEREEAVNSLDGKLQNDLIRFRDILRVATSQSIVIINEIFGSTTLRDALFLSDKIISRLIELDLICVCVTFIDELLSLSPKMVSLVCTVVPDDPAIRTFKVVRRPSDGRAYAVSIAEKYRLTYELIISRLEG